MSKRKKKGRRMNSELRRLIEEQKRDMNSTTIDYSGNPKGQDYYDRRRRVPGSVFSKNKDF